MSVAQLSWNAATLDERLAFLRMRPDLPVPIDTSVAGSVPAPWVQACAAGDTAAFLRRLEWDGIELTVARAAMSPIAPDGFSAAPWTQQLPAAMAAMKASARASADDWESAVERIGADLPFVDVWLPLVHAASRDLFDEAPECSRWLSVDARLALERHLAAGLCRVGELAVHGLFVQQAGGATPSGTDTYRAFVRNLLSAGGAPLFSAYPVLARHVLQIAGQWCDATRELVRRLDADRAQLEATFGMPVTRVRHLRAGLSDRHAGGRQVMHVTFESGLQVAYKPRDIAVEQACNAFLRWLEQSGMPSAPPSLRALGRESHGWVEWVEQGQSWSRESARTYFRQAGALVAVAYVLGGADLHSENLVASARGPVLVDTEMLLQPSTKPSAPTDGGDESDVASTGDSCLLSGLVSAVVIDRRGMAFDVGGLRPAVARELAVPARHWVGLRTDAVSVRAETRVQPGLRNTVVVNGVVQHPEDFVDDISSGFAETCRFLYDRRVELEADDGPVSAFGTCPIRVLFRPSDQYAAALYLTAAPRYQASGLARSLALETLYRVFISETERPRIWPLVADERAALEQLDIPRVTLAASSTALTTGAGVSIDGYYVTSGLQAVRHRLALLGPAERRAQDDLLRAALMTDTRGSVPAPRASSAADRCVAAAEQLGAAVLARAEPGDTGLLAWPSSGTRRDLYGGASGIGLFLAGLGAITGEQAWTDAALQVFGPIAAETELSRHDVAPRLGACTGEPSVAYALALSGRLLDVPDLVHAAQATALRISPEAIDGDAVLDVEGGSAGMLLALLAIQRVAPEDGLLMLADRCVRRLLATQVVEGAHAGAWRAGDQPVARPGFAHGASGIAAALSRWATITGGNEVPDAVRAAWTFERRIAAANDGRYPTERSDGSRLVMAAWCHGAPGIALGRLLAPPSLVDAALRQEIDEAVRQTLEAPAGQLDHLCCGNLGRADAALTAGLVSGVEAWVEGARAIANEVAGRVLGQGRLGMRGRGFQRGAASPALFQGLAGIGYQLLRTAAPARLPSLLTFDMPAARSAGGTIS